MSCQACDGYVIHNTVSDHDRTCGRTDEPRTPRGRLPGPHAHAGCDRVFVYRLNHAVEERRSGGAEAPPSSRPGAHRHEADGVNGDRPVGPGPAPGPGGAWQPARPTRPVAPGATWSATHGGRAAQLGHRQAMGARIRLRLRAGVHGRGCAPGGGRLLPLAGCLLTVCSHTVRIRLDVPAHCYGKWAGQAHSSGRG
jgi:hypothetical protein